MKINEMSREKFKQLPQEQKEKLLRVAEQKSRWRRNSVNYKIRLLKGKAGLIERIKQVHERLKHEGMAKS